MKSNSIIKAWMPKLVLNKPQLFVGCINVYTLLKIKCSPQLHSVSPVDSSRICKQTKGIVGLTE